MFLTLMMLMASPLNCSVVFVVKVVNSDRKKKPRWWARLKGRGRGSSYFASSFTNAAIMADCATSMPATHMMSEALVSASFLSTSA
jgi:hypothetical protein